MAQGTILTTPEAERASSQMKSIIEAGLTEQIDSLIREGNTLSEPTVWDGNHANTFRSSWPTTSRQLREARDELARLQQAVEQVRQDIVSAGGG
jgi:uncharacterized protein YukE